MKKNNALLKNLSPRSGDAVCQKAPPPSNAGTANINIANANTVSIIKNTPFRSDRKGRFQLFIKILYQQACPEADPASARLYHLPAKRSGSRPRRLMPVLR
jgi:hypothetical protein